MQQEEKEAEELLGEIDLGKVKEKVEEVLGRQRDLSEDTRRIVREKLSALDWDEFSRKALKRYYAHVERKTDSLTSAECNALLMDAIKEEIEAEFFKLG